jgi:Restriction endonuclease
LLDRLDVRKHSREKHMSKSGSIAPWRQYQERTARLFRSLGYKADVEAKLNGARARHVIDVLVTLTIGGVEVRWIVECKYWRKRVSKLHTVALAEIVKDVGADRAFLLSEVGFQSGAISAARYTNISLTSLEELKTAAFETLRQIRSLESLRRKADLQRQLRGLLFDDQGNMLTTEFEEVDAVADPLGACLIIDLTLQKFSLGSFPIWIDPFMGVPGAQHRDPDSLLDHIAALLDRIEERKEALTLERNDRQRAIVQESDLLLAEVKILLQLAESSLCASNATEEPTESSRILCLESMKKVARAAESLRNRMIGRPGHELKALMRLLKDTVYLELTKPSIPSDRWRICREAVELQMERLRVELNRPSASRDAPNSEEHTSYSSDSAEISS